MYCLKCGKLLTDNRGILCHSCNNSELADFCEDIDFCNFSTCEICDCELNLQFALCALCGRKVCLNCCMVAEGDDDFYYVCDNCLDEEY